MEGLDRFALDDRASPQPLYALAVLIAAACLVLVFAQGLFDVNTGHAPYVFLGALAWVLTFQDLRVGLALTIIAVAISPEFEIGGVPNLRMEDFIFPAVLLGWMAKALHAREPLAATDLKTPLILLALVAVLSSLQNYIYARLPFWESFFRLGKSGMYVLMFFVTLNVLKQRKDVGAFMQVFWMAAAASALYAVARLWLYPDDHRLHGPPGETGNIFGGFLVFHICILLGMACTRSKGKALPLCIAAAMAVPFVHTLSRTSWIALLAGLIVLAVLGRDRAIAGFLMLVIALVVTTQARDRFGTFFGFVSGDVPSAWQARVDGWRLYLFQMGFSPLTGEGIGRAPLAIDSEYVKQLYELGVLGLGLFAWVMVRCARAARRLAAGTTDARYRGFAIGYLAGLTALLVHSVAAPTFTTIRTAEPFCIATGLIYAGLATLPARETQPELPRELTPVRFARRASEGARAARV